MRSLQMAQTQSDYEMKKYFLLCYFMILISSILSGNEQINEKTTLQGDISFTEDFIINNLIFNGNSYFSDSKLFELTNQTKENNLSLSELTQFLEEITDLYLSRGMLFVKIRIEEIIELGIGSWELGVQLPTPNSQLPTLRGVCAIINITEGPIVRAENFIISGNKTIKEKTIIKESGLKSNQIVTPLDINTAQRKIMTKPYIISCSIEPMNQNTLLIHILEGNTTYLSGILGYNSIEKKNNFTGFVDLDFLNLFGTDRSLSFSWKKFENDFSSILFKYHESGPSEIPIAGDLILYREERDSTYIRTRIETDIYYLFNTQKIGFSLGTEELIPGNRQPKQLEKQTERQIGIFWEGDFTDNILNPRTGWDMSVKQSLLFITRETDHLQRYKTEVKVANYMTLGKSLVLANTATCWTIENNSLTFYDLLKVGGAFSLRGFFEDTYAGDIIAFTNSELRFLMTHNSRVFLFIDYGYVEDNRPGFDNRFADLFGFGLGMRLDTRIGLLRIDYGFHHANGKWLNPSDGIVHFGIETRF